MNIFAIFCPHHCRIIFQVIVDEANVISGGWDQRVVFWVKIQFLETGSQGCVSETGGGWVQVQWSREAWLLCEHPLRWQHPSLLCWRKEWIPCQDIQILVSSILVQMFMNIPQNCCSQIIANVYSSLFSSAIACWITFTLSTNSWWASLSLICAF